MFRHRCESCGTTWLDSYTTSMCKGCGDTKFHTPVIDGKKDELRGFTSKTIRVLIKSSPSDRQALLEDIEAAKRFLDTIKIYEEA